MALTEKQRADLEALGAATVRMKLVQSGAGWGASLSGFKSGDITRGDVEEWLAQENKKEERRQVDTLRWAKIAGWAAIISIIVTAVGIWLQK
jgi:hypothetical protein